MVGGCATATTSRAPGTDLGTLKTFYVSKLPADGRGVERLIAARLNMMGYKATSGPSEKPPGPVDAIVTYQDKWMWDITMYMVQLDVQVRDPQTDMVLASGRSWRPSLQRKTPEGMVQEVLENVFKK